MTFSLAIVVPAYNESAVVDIFHARLSAVLDGIDATSRVIYVDDGSQDGTWQVLCAVAGRDARVETIRLSRNFGKEAAMTAGFDAADADAVVVIDIDLQDPPELIPALVARWQEGFDVVYATRGERDGETRTKKFTSAAFYRVMERLSDTPLPRDTGDFRLLSRRAVDALRQLRERQRFMKGLFTWIGYRQTSVTYHREARRAGATKWNYWRLTNLAIEGITSFSTAPLRLATWVGVSAATLAFLYGLWIVLKVLLWGDPVRGYPTLMVVILFLGGAQLLALGVIGEYVGRTYSESKRRPLYYVDEHRGGRPSPSDYSTLPDRR
ncbi:Glycosyltransferase involved in cell wall bisynthesis [Luteibacter sp. UNC138MFCol5.1]|uniref:glycosyltransferase family 2 protein n=1 Tax=Luteibacter sp. UNC138MFCol5.1 TaxID=1502774 RepID=UPI0008CC9B61|nr:glycosyltransferase family 2 protein [Luteibacter sp. UNC138MFCol5.1]SEP05260.1 Glycosyltransferase involved in cell wall bisynthesis [Luteibacter sp. UNC138MFCol5.1]